MKKCCSLENIDVEIPDIIEREMEAKGGFDEIYRSLAKHDTMAMATMTKVLGDEKRLTMLLALARQRMCVCMLAELTGCTYSKCSYHIARLKDAGLIEPEHLGNYLIYSLTSHGREIVVLLEKIYEAEENHG
ncbi:MAG: metalloregulator ArsR/SmtB family transcription factor [Thermoplasmatota archaeon]